MTERVVNALEVVDVEVRQNPRHPLPPAPLHRAIECPEEGATVRDPGQGIFSRERTELHRLLSENGDQRSDEEKEQELRRAVPQEELRAGTGGPRLPVEHRAQQGGEDRVGDSRRATEMPRNRNDRRKVEDRDLQA